LLSGVKHVSSYQPWAQPLREVAQAGQVFGANGRSGFHLDGDHSAISGFQDGVYLDFVLGPVMVQACPFLAPGELAGEFHQHECLDHGSRCPVGFTEAARVLAEQVRSDASIDECQLGGANGPLGLAS
jgi:hypothetical protein